MGCQQCSECCRYFAVEVEPDHDGFYRWLTFHGGRIIRFDDEAERAGRTYVRIDVPCEKLDKNGKCTIYPWRPEMCKAYLCGKARTAAKSLLEP